MGIQSKPIFVFWIYKNNSYEDPLFVLVNDPGDRFTSLQPGHESLRGSQSSEREKVQID